MPSALDIQRKNLPYDSGRCSALTTSLITDGSKSWPVNAWAGYYVRMLGGANDGAVRMVVSNTATTLTLNAVLTNAIESPVDCDYEVFDGLGGAGQGTALAIAAVGTATRTSAAMINPGSRGLHLRVVLSSYTDGTWTPRLEVLEADGTTWTAIWIASAGLSSATTGLYQLFPGGASGGGEQYTEQASIALPSGQFRIVLTVSGAPVTGAVTMADYLLIR